MLDRLPTQLTLGVRLRDEARLDNFFVSTANAACIKALTNPGLDNRFIYLWGGLNTGRTHLLQALCQRPALAGQGVLYLPLQHKQQLDARVLQGSSSLSMVGLDDLDAVCDDHDWESAIFHFFNLLQETDTQLLVTASCPPQHLPIGLADLHSRLQSALVLQLSPLDDRDKCSMLSLRAANRGMELGRHVAEYIVQRADRRLDSLIAVLDKLDGETLQKGRRLTIPFVRDVMGW